jgi:hypothetical protein
VGGGGTAKKGAYGWTGSWFLISTKLLKKNDRLNLALLLAFAENFRLLAYYCRFLNLSRKNREISGPKNCLK